MMLKLPNRHICLCILLEYYYYYFFALKREKCHLTFQQNFILSHEYIFTLGNTIV